MAKVGVIGGSGLYDMPGLEVTGQQDVETPFGMPSAPLMLGRLESHEIVFLSRHGIQHSYPPHKVNYRANVHAMKLLGVERIIAVCACGGINPAMAPGSIVVLDQVLDFTGGMREATIFDSGQVVHVDFTEPYCPDLRSLLLSAARYSEVKVHNSGTYICVNGPRLESAAEIRYFGSIGADVVGMTGMPEAVLAREHEICYASLAVVTNKAAGISEGKLTTEEVVDQMKKSTDQVKQIIKSALELMPWDRSCACKDALSGSSM